MQKISVVGLVILAVVLVFGTGYWFLKGGHDMSALGATVEAQPLSGTTGLQVIGGAQNYVIPQVSDPQQNSKNPQSSFPIQSVVTNSNNQIQGNGL